MMTKQRIVRMTKDLPGYPAVDHHVEVDDGIANALKAAGAAVVVPAKEAAAIREAGGCPSLF